MRTELNAESHPLATPGFLRVKLLLWGVLLGLVGLVLTVCGVLLHIILSWLRIGPPDSQAWLAWTGGIITMLALAMVAAEIFLILPLRRLYPRRTEGDGFAVSGLTVALT